MLASLGIAVFLAVCLAFFWGVNLYNLRRHSTERRGEEYRVEVDRPGGVAVMLAAFGTGVFFLESGLYIILAFMDHFWILGDSVFQLRFSFDSQVQLSGIVITGFGYALFIWSVLARGKFATSWEMPQNQELVTWGPYRYVRHPSYLAYFILFTGFFLIVLNLLAAIPLVAIPSYVGLVNREEELLTRRFGVDYLKYRRKTGRFLPRRKT